MLIEDYSLLSYYCIWSRDINLIHQRNVNNKTISFPQEIPVYESWPANKIQREVKFTISVLACVTWFILKQQTRMMTKMSAKLEIGRDQQFLSRCAVWNTNKSSMWKYQAYNWMYIRVQ